MGDCNLGSQDQGASASFINDLNRASQMAEEEIPETPTVGTPYYLAPEIWKMKKYGKESDIWALGVILYELCCLKYPFPATELDELEKKVLNDKPDKFPNGVSAEFIDFFNKMLKKDPSKRPCIYEIIYNDVFQQKAEKNLITLPLKLNKQKLQHKFSLYGG
jgi:serine/threonine protein kinase